MKNSAPIFYHYAEFYKIQNISHSVNEPENLKSEFYGIL